MDTVTQESFERLDNTIRILAPCIYPEDLKRYLLEELFVPAERIRRVVQAREEERG